MVSALDFRGEWPVHGGRVLSYPCVSFTAGNWLDSAYNPVNSLVLKCHKNYVQNRDQNVCYEQKLMQLATPHEWTMHCFRGARVKGNGRADRLAGKATVTSGLRLGRSEVLRSLRHSEELKCWGARDTARGNKARDTTLPIAWRRGVERGRARWSSLEGRERAIIIQTNIGTVSRATLRERLRDGMECTWALPSA